MSRWTLGLALVAPLFLFAPPSRADLLAPGEKGVRSSIRVEGSVPAGKALVLAHTFHEVDVLALDGVTPIDWHPGRGEMQIVLIDEGTAAKIKVVRDKGDDVKDPEAILKAGTMCGAPFQGARTLPDTSAAEEVRWVYAVRMDGAACNATLVRTDHLTKAGEVVQSTPGGSASGAGGSPPVPTATASHAQPGPTAAASHAPSGSPTAAAAPSGNGAAPGAVAGGCGTCALAAVEPAPAPAAGLSLLAVVGLLFGRRRRRR